MKPKTIADLKRLPLGTVVFLLNDRRGLHRRELIQVRSADLVFRTDDGRKSWLPLKGCRIEPTEIGFDVINKEFPDQRASYAWEM